MSFRSTTFLFGLLLGMLWLFGLTVAHKKTAVDASFLMRSLQANPLVVIDSITIARKVKDKEPEQRLGHVVCKPSIYKTAFIFRRVKLRGRHSTLRRYGI